MRSTSRGGLLVIALACVGCSTEITRTYVVDPATASAFGARAKVVALDRYASQRDIRAGVLDATGTTLTTRDETMHLAPTDRVTVRVRFASGDRVPNEGRVLQRASTPLMIGGAISLGVGALAIVVGMCGVAEQCTGGRNYGAYGTSNYDAAGAALLSSAIGGAFIIGGIIAFIMGAIPKDTVVAERRVTLGPGALRARF